MKRQGFTLLEVAISVGILAIALTAILSSQIVALKTGMHAERATIATFLARCKMAEVEEQMLKEGFTLNEIDGSDDCCEEAEVEGFTCDWVVSPIVLPEADLDADGGVPAPEEGAEGDDVSEAPSIDSVLAGGGGGTDELATMAFSYAFPILKPRIEQQVRRAQVTVKWKEGNRERTFDVVQYLVAEPGEAGVDLDGQP